MENIITFEEIEKVCDVSRETFTTLMEFATLIEKWNRSINLISKTTSVSELWQRHMIDSMQLFRFIPTETKVLTDFGSGGGFPGLILSFLGVPEVHLVESDKRKCAFLREASLLSKQKVVVHDARIESLTPWKSDIITARGLASLSELLDLVYPFVDGHTVCLFQKGKHASEELEDTDAHWAMTIEFLPSMTSSEATILKLQSIQRKRAL